MSVDTRSCDMCDLTQTDWDRCPDCGDDICLHCGASMHDEYPHGLDVAAVNPDDLPPRRTITTVRPCGRIEKED